MIAVILAGHAQNPGILANTNSETAKSTSISTIAFLFDMLQEENMRIQNENCGN